jgi:hypothetical protein
MLSTGHAYGTTADTMEITTTRKEGRYLNTSERYNIYEISRENLHTNDTHIDTHKPIFETLHRITVHSSPHHPSPPPHSTCIQTRKIAHYVHTQELTTTS